LNLFPPPRGTNRSQSRFHSCRLSESLFSPSTGPGPQQNIAAYESVNLPARGQDVPPWGVPWSSATTLSPVRAHPFALFFCNLWTDRDEQRCPPHPPAQVIRSARILLPGGLRRTSPSSLNHAFRWPDELHRWSLPFPLPFPMGYRLAGKDSLGKGNPFLGIPFPSPNLYPLPFFRGFG